VLIYSKNLWNAQKERFEEGLLQIEKGRFVRLEYACPKGVQAKKKILDFGESFLGPSSVDLHVHSRGFKESHKETFETLECAALKGGVSVAACMANTFPRLDTPARIQDFFKQSLKQKVRFIPFAAVTKNLEGVEPTDWAKLLSLPIAGLSDDGKPILSEAILSGAMKATDRAKKILSLHEEDTRISRASPMHLSETSMRLGFEGSPSEAEWQILKRDLQLGSSLKASLHFAHLSSAESVKILAEAKRRGIAYSAELTPHHALLSVDEAERFSFDQISNFKVCPPIRGVEDRAALLKAVALGVIDCFASDHAPHSTFEKEVPFDQAAHGMIAMEYYFPLLNEIRLQAKMSWARFYRAASSRPSQLLRLDPPFMKGSRASFLVFDPNDEQTLIWSRSKSKNTPFEGRKIRGRILAHWIEGVKVYEEK